MGYVLSALFLRIVGVLDLLLAYSVVGLEESCICNIRLGILLFVWSLKWAVQNNQKPSSRHYVSLENCSENLIEK